MYTVALIQGLAQGIQFSGQQRTRAGFCRVPGHTVGRRLGPVGGAKGVHDEYIAK